MSETKERAYLSIGSTVEFNGDTRIQLDNANLKDFVTYLQKFGEKYLAGLTNDQIRAGQKLKAGDPNRIPRITVYEFKPSEGAPEFIKANLAIKVKQD